MSEDREAIVNRFDAVAELIDEHWPGPVLRLPTPRAAKPHDIIVVEVPLDTLERIVTSAIPKGNGKRRYSDVAERLARAEWERRKTKPVCGFPALRLRIQEALDAGHTPDAVARAMPSMPVFSRNAFDFALSRSRTGGHLTPSDRALAEDPDYWKERS